MTLARSLSPLPPLPPLPPALPARWELNPQYWPRYSGASCPLLRREFNCEEHGRDDLGFLKWVWKSPACNINL